jgi:hypothetical protein
VKFGPGWFKSAHIYVSIPMFLITHSLEILECRIPLEQILNETLKEKMTTRGTLTADYRYENSLGPRKGDVIIV